MVHYGQAAAVLAARQTLLTTAKATRPPNRARENRIARIAGVSRPRSRKGSSSNLLCLRRTNSGAIGATRGRA
jgi:hypothetical protein